MNKLSLVLSLALLVPTSAALADTELGLQTDVKVNAGVGVDSRSIKAEGRGDAAVSSDEDSARGEFEATGTADGESANRSNAKARAEEHRSAVASFVQSLLRDADRDGGIGAEVRAVARSQEEAASTTVTAMAKLEKRGKFMEFLFGSDWKNLGTLRSQIAKTESDAKRLASVLSRTTDASVKANLETQLNVLKAEQAKIEAFVDAHTNTFSLFGWFTKLFVGTSTES